MQLLYLTSFVWLPGRHALKVMGCTHRSAVCETRFGALVEAASLSDGQDKSNSIVCTQSRSLLPVHTADAVPALQAMKAAVSGAPKKDPAASIATLVQSVILLREALTALPGLAQVLQPAKAELLKAVRPAPSAGAFYRCLLPSCLQL